MLNKNSCLVWLVALMALSGCRRDTPEVPDAGMADFSNYVAIGNSLTAGYADGSLYREGQLNAYPAMLAARFQQAGGGSFRQPLLPGEAGWPSPKLVLSSVVDCKGNDTLRPVRFSGISDTAGSAANMSASGPFNNLGIPGIRCIDYLMAGYGALNPYARRFFAQPAAETAMSVAVASKATFFTIWLGGNDVLGYATSGGEGTVNGIGLSDISPLAYFKSVYDSLVSGMVAGGAKGVLINIPDITAIPYFTTVSPRGLQLQAAEAAALMQHYAGSGMSFSEGQNYYVIEDPGTPSGFRQITADEYILLDVPIDSLTCGTWGSLTPIPGSFVLSMDETDHVREATDGFNQVIHQAAVQHGLAFFDAEAYLNALRSGIESDGVHYDTKYLTGGVFSLDGIHLTPRGYALVANEIIKAINREYRATLPLLNTQKYAGVSFP